jgi:hypothetical protein
LYKEAGTFADWRLGSLLSDQHHTADLLGDQHAPVGQEGYPTWTIWKGRLGSGFCSPALICASAWVAARARKIPAITNCFISFFPLAVWIGPAFANLFHFVFFLVFLAIQALIVDPVSKFSA